jgi:truncated hemoglobin YjbI
LSRIRLQELYQKIGGRDRLNEILRDFYQRMAEDTLIGYFFTGKDLHQIAQKQAEFILHVIGENPNYSGKLPVSAHLDLPPIFSGHFDRRQILLRETLKDQGFSAEEAQIWIDFENAFRGVIVQSDPYATKKIP